MRIILVRGQNGGRNELVLLYGGDYDITRKDDLKSELARIEPHGDVVLDLTTTASIDCSCLGVLIAQLREWRRHNPRANLRLRNVSPNISKTLRLLKLDELFVLEKVRFTGWNEPAAATLPDPWR